MINAMSSELKTLDPLLRTTSPLDDPPTGAMVGSVPWDVPLVLDDEGDSGWTRPDSTNAAYLSAKQVVLLNSMQVPFPLLLLPALTNSHSRSPFDVP
jgi:hypothetical protein